MLDVDAIDPDPEQPRKQDNPGFSEESIKELADTIKARGVKMPVSVRENPEQAGRYIINHGERRWRASKVVGRNKFPLLSIMTIATMIRSLRTSSVMT